jgi:hydrogenase nickel incorporation protein HypA/HybF
MHELSIATCIVEMAEEESERRGGIAIEAVHLQLGALSGVVKDALLSCYDLACEGTRLEGSRLVIEEVPVIVYCPACDKKSPLTSLQSFRCPQCGAFTNDVVQGRELQVAALEIRQCA